MTTHHLHVETKSYRIHPHTHISSQENVLGVPQIFKNIVWGRIFFSHAVPGVCKKLPEDIKSLAFGFNLEK